MVELSVGTVVAERFRLARLLGEGGMGSVWLAHHVKLDMPCAVKFINADLASEEGVKERFEREAKIAAQIKSPHVVQVLDYGVSDGIPYIAMEYLEGEDLAQRLVARGRLSPQETLAFVAQIARALTKAHAAGLVHRDLKPENVYLVRDDDHEIVKVLDFGIAKAKNPSPDARTRTGALMGTPRYMSPEQAQGVKTLDYRSDLWSLAVIAYRCVVGVLPFDSDAMGDLMMRIIVHPLPVPSQVLPGLPPGFDAWWNRAAARDPAARFQSAKDLADAFATAFGLVSAVSGASGVAAVASAPTQVLAASGSAYPSGAPSGAPGFRAVTPPSGQALSHSMVGAATALPGGVAREVTPPPAVDSGYQSIPGAAPAQTMSAASRTFSSEGPRRSPTGKLLALGILGVVVLGVGATVVLLRGKPREVAVANESPAAVGPSASASSPPPASSAPDPLPKAESSAANVDVGAPAPPTEEGAPSSSSPPAKQPSGHPKTLHPTPPPPPAPARKGKVKILPPGG